MALFGSTSPSYLILQSLDSLCAYLSDGYSQALASFLPLVQSYQKQWEEQGFVFVGDEPMKLTLNTKAFGYLGTHVADLLRDQGIECEFADPDFLVLMLSCQLGKDGLERLSKAFDTILPKAPIRECPPHAALPRRVMSVRDAMFANSEWVAIEAAKGRILSSLSLSCPPAVPIAVCGEQIDENVLTLFDYYGIDRCRVVAD